MLAMFMSSHNSEDFREARVLRGRIQRKQGAKDIKTLLVFLCFMGIYGLTLLPFVCCKPTRYTL